MKAKGTMTTTTTKPTQFDKDGLVKTDGFLAVTIKFDLEQFSDADLGGLLLMLARGENVFVEILSQQMYLELGNEVIDLVTDAG